MIKHKINDVPGLLCSGLEIVAGAALMLVTGLSGCDIIGRAFGHPIPGTYEIVSFAGGLVVGLAIPITSRVKGHVIIDIALDKFPEALRHKLFLLTRFMGIVLFLMIGYSTFKMGTQIRSAGEVTQVLGLPIYPAAYAMGIAFFMECIILAEEAIRSMIGGGKDE
jgi:TRAP-type C4-dicarboxylate transport system permease small subunit